MTVANWAALDLPKAEGALSPASVVGLRLRGIVAVQRGTLAVDLNRITDEQFSTLEAAGAIGEWI